MADNSSESPTTPSSSSSKAPRSQPNAFARPNRPDHIIDSGASVPSPTPSLTTGLRTLNLERFTSVHKIPCAREAFLTGLGAGFALGGLHLVLRGSVMRSANWFVGSWAVGSIGGYQFCQKRREMERAGMGRAKEIMRETKLRKDREMDAAREEVKRKREEEEAREKERERRWGSGWREWFREGKERSVEEGKKVKEELRAWEESKLHGESERDRKKREG